MAGSPNHVSSFTIREIKQLRTTVRACVVNGSVFKVPARYRGLKYQGGGSYGTVCSADDVLTGQRVAIKKVGDTFADLIDAKRILREIKLLRHLGSNCPQVPDDDAAGAAAGGGGANANAKGKAAVAAAAAAVAGAELGPHENILDMVDLFTSPREAGTNFRDIYIVTPLMDTDLGRIVESKQPLTDAHARYFLYQLLRGMKYVHSANVLHRDLKPSNLLVNSNCELRICDFGLARGVTRDLHASDALTEYVVTRWYRAPELLTECDVYGQAMDVWSIGCIFAEVLGRQPLFRGHNYIHQLETIVKVLGNPSEADTDFITNAEARRTVRRMARRARRPWAEVLPRASPLALDLLDRMLRFAPHRRITVEEALAHPYLSEYHAGAGAFEPTASASFKFDFETDNVLPTDNETIPKKILQRLMLAEARDFGNWQVGGGAAAASSSKKGKKGAKAGSSSKGAKKEKKGRRSSSSKRRDDAASEEDSDAVTPSAIAPTMASGSPPASPTKKPRRGRRAGAGPGASTPVFYEEKAPDDGAAVADGAAATAPAPAAPGLTEDDVRRVVREEMAGVGAELRASLGRRFDERVAAAEASVTREVTAAVAQKMTAHVAHAVDRAVAAAVTASVAAATAALQGRIDALEASVLDGFNRAALAGSRPASAGSDASSGSAGSAGSAARATPPDSPANPEGKQPPESTTGGGGRGRGRRSRKGSRSHHSAGRGKQKERLTRSSSSGGAALKPQPGQQAGGGDAAKAAGGGADESLSTRIAFAVETLVSTRLADFRTDLEGAFAQTIKTTLAKAGKVGGPPAAKPKLREPLSADRVVAMDLTAGTSPKLSPAPHNWAERSGGHSPNPFTEAIARRSLESHRDKAKKASKLASRRKFPASMSLVAKALPGVCSLSDAGSTPDSGGLGPARYLNTAAPVPSKSSRMHRRRSSERSADLGGAHRRRARGDSDDDPTL